LKIYILQGVATQLSSSGIFSNHFITHFPQNVPVKSFENRTKICGLLFWPTRYGYFTYLLEIRNLAVSRYVA